MIQNNYLLRRLTPVPQVCPTINPSRAVLELNMNGNTVMEVVNNFRL